MADGDPIVQGTVGVPGNYEQTTTIVANVGPSLGTTLELFAGVGGAPGDGLYSVAHQGSGVHAYSYNGDGVHGIAVPGGGLAGVRGTGYATTGVYGEDLRGGTGVAGYSSRGVGTTGWGALVGTFGRADAEGGYGVYGIHSMGHRGGTGVFGFARTGVLGDGTIGVVGRSADDFGIGVEGDSTGEGGVGVFGATTAAAGGVGVYATAPSAGSHALQVQGRAQFSSSGRLTVPAGASSATSTAATITPASLVLATMQQDVPGVAVRAAVPDPATGSFTVHLTQAPAADTEIAWFVIN